MDALLDNPDDLDAFLVEGDRLQAAGDARGELVVVQTLLARTPDDAALAARAEALLAAHAPEWIDHREGDPQLDLVWRHGFVDAVDLAADDELDALARLLAAPAGRLVRTVTYDSWHYDVRFFAVLAALQPSPLRTLSVGQWSPRHEPGEGEVELGDVSDVWRAHPRLESLSLTGTPTTLGDIRAPRLRSFSWSGFGRDEVLAELARAAWPALERFSLHYLYYSDLDALADRLLDARGLPHLRHLTLGGSAVDDWLPARLPRSRLLPQLLTLDLSWGQYKDRDVVRRLEALRRDPAFRHLQTFAP